jgi:hypothetical protein
LGGDIGIDKHNNDRDKNGKNEQERHFVLDAYEFEFWVQERTSMAKVKP